jgi:glycosyltransferase involved in cell wall biosynthesis
MDISVVLSSYNPRMDYLSRVLQALREQTLPADRWELVVVDNASKPPLEGRLDLGGLPAARMVVELKQGLSHARRRGFQEARADVIINLDDDTVLDRDYLERTMELAAQYPFIGAFGCQIQAEFEQPPTWPAEEYYSAIRKVEREVWSNDMHHHASNPWGAASVVRKEVALAYASKLERDERLSLVGRKPGELLACEDDDIAMTACEIGLGKGVFPSLRLTHLIPANKMTEEFQSQNAHGKGYSSTVLNYLRFQKIPTVGLLAKINRIYRLARMGQRRRRQEIATDRGVRDALRDMQKWGWLKEGSSQR